MPSDSKSVDNYSLDTFIFFPDLGKTVKYSIVKGTCVIVRVVFTVMPVGVSC